MDELISSNKRPVGINRISHHIELCETDRHGVVFLEAIGYFFIRRCFLDGREWNFLVSGLVESNLVPFFWGQFLHQEALNLGGRKWARCISKCLIYGGNTRGYVVWVHFVDF